jgi:dienelactone hydrolase
MSPRIVVRPRVALRDTPVTIQLLGLAATQEITLRAGFDLAQNRWESSATFRADADGTVDVATQAPLAGTYTGVDPMGLFWSMTQSSLPERDMASDRARGDLDPVTVTFTAESEGDAVATVAVERQLVATDVTRIPVRVRGLVGTFFLPAGAGPFPAVIQWGGSGGGLAEITAALLASHGYAALALAYFGVESLPPTLAEIPLEYFETAIDWVGEQSGVDDRRVAVMGTSRGGELALLVGATVPRVRAVIGYVPSGVMWAGFPAVPADGPCATWTYRGEPLPFLSVPVPEDVRAGIQRSREAGEPIVYTPSFLSQLADTAAVERATIPVEKIRGPILLISGEDDLLWPATRFSGMVMERLARHGHQYPYRHLHYPGAGHLIGPPGFPTTVNHGYNPSGKVDIAYGGTAQGTAHAQADSWQKVLSFLAESLRRA